MDRIVVVGAGLGGLRSVEALRRGGFRGDITVVGDEPHAPYNRPPLSKDVLQGRADDQSCFFQPIEAEATWLLGHAATSLDLRAGELVIDGERLLPFDRLVIATGVRARTWPNQPSLRGLHTVRTLDDARALRESARIARDAVVIGGGFIGCEIAATLRGSGINVTMLDLSAQLMAPLGQEIGRRALDWHEAAGVRVMLGVEVDSIVGQTDVEVVRLTDGAEIESDVIVVGTGAVPNTEWLSGSGLELMHGGVRCDERCLALGAPDVGVVGDVASWPDPWTGQSRRVEHWFNAVESAMTAAANLLAREGIPMALHQPVPRFWSNQYDYKIKAVGWLSAADAVSIVVDAPEERRIVAEFRREGQLVGAVTVNDHRADLQYRRLIGAVTPTLTIPSSRGPLHTTAQERA